MSDGIDVEANERRILADTCRQLAQKVLLLEEAVGLITKVLARNGTPIDEPLPKNLEIEGVRIEEFALGYRMTHLATGVVAESMTQMGAWTLLMSRVEELLKEQDEAQKK